MWELLVGVITELRATTDSLGADRHLGRFSLQIQALDISLSVISMHHASYALSTS
jgi:hypothetical protein